MTDLLLTRRHEKHTLFFSLSNVCTTLGCFVNTANVTSSSQRKFYFFFSPVRPNLPVWECWQAKPRHLWISQTGQSQNTERKKTSLLHLLAGVQSIGCKLRLQCHFRCLCELRETFFKIHIQKVFSLLTELLERKSFLFFS